jgi:hypothetical protein
MVLDAYIYLSAADYLLWTSCKEILIAEDKNYSMID